MALAHRNTQTGYADAVVSSVSASKPTGLADNDVLVAFVSCSNMAATWATPSGWAPLSSNVVASYNGLGAVVSSFYRVVTSAAGEPGTYTFTLASGSGFTAVELSAVSGANTLGPVDTYGAMTNAAGSKTWTMTAPFSLVAANELVLGCVSAIQTNATSFPVSDGSSWTFRGETPADSAPVKLELYSKAYTATGPVADITVTGSSSKSAEIPHGFVYVALVPAVTPTLSVTAPAAAGTVSTGGPNLTVSWTTGNGTQATYRVKVTNAAASTTYYDSGVVAGVTASVVLDCVSLGIPTDTTGAALKATVAVTTVGGGATATNSFDVQWGVVTCTITVPTASQVIGTDQVTATWTFASTRGFTQQSYRIRLLSGSGAVLYDSGWVASASTSITVPYVLPDSSTFTLGVQLKNTMGVPS